jgi:hypothetical protein
MPITRLYHQYQGYIIGCDHHVSELQTVNYKPSGMKGISLSAIRRALSLARKSAAWSARVAVLSQIADWLQSSPFFTNQRPAVL